MSAENKDVSEREGGTGMLHECVGLGIGHLKNE
jgi:hypothetical protein